MFVCTCCGKWTIEEHPAGLRIKHYGYWIRDVRTIEEVEEILRRQGVTLADMEEKK